MNKELFEQGMQIRRKVVGDTYVDASMSNADEFSMPMQELVTQYCWGDVWGRPGLDMRSRSLLNLGMISALNRPSELAALEDSAVKVVVDLSTVGGAATQEVAAALRQQGVELVDAPVSGGAAGAQEGTLAVMVAGQTRQVWHAAASQGGASDDLTAIVRFMERWSSSRE
ncbi:MAG: NAD(P)-binding domain-containing protein [Burkholderiaceae bacterium]